MLEIELNGKLGGREIHVCPIKLCLKGVCELSRYDLKEQDRVIRAVDINRIILDVFWVLRHSH